MCKGSMEGINLVCCRKKMQFAGWKQKVMQKMLQDVWRDGQGVAFILKTPYCLQKQSFRSIKQRKVTTWEGIFFAWLVGSFNNHSDYLLYGEQTGRIQKWKLGGK